MTRIEVKEKFGEPDVMNSRSLYYFDECVVYRRYRYGKRYTKRRMQFKDNKLQAYDEKNKKWVGGNVPKEVTEAYTHFITEKILLGAS